MNHLPALYIEAEPADIIEQLPEGTFIGRYDRTKYDISKPAEDQPIWSIRFFSTPDETTTKTLYPDGRRIPLFVWSKRTEYEYKYAL